MKAIVLLSAGLDSAVAFKKAYDVFGREILCLTFDYGQKARDQELERAAQIADRFGAKRKVVSLPWLASFNSSLLRGEVPTIQNNELDDLEVARKTAKSVWVPARNVVFIAVAAAYAENSGYGTIITGYDKEEAITFPDNSSEFIRRFNKLLEYGTLKHVEVWAPLQDLDKTQIVELGAKIDAPLDLSWSCYSDDKLPCGTCESCVRRQRAFKNANLVDPGLCK